MSEGAYNWGIITEAKVGLTFEGLIIGCIFCLQVDELITGWWGIISGGSYTRGGL